MFSGKKKLLLSIALCIFTAAGISARHQIPDAYIGDMRLAGMAGAYTAVADDQNSLMFNPAGIGTVRSSRLGMVMHYADQYNEDFGLYEPSVMPQFFFIAPGWGANISSSFHLESREEENTYDIVKVNEVDLGFGFGLGMFSAGVSLHASKVSKADQVALSSSDSNDFVMDFFQQVLLNDGYETSGEPEEAESVLVRAGMLFDTGIFSFGAFHGSIFDVMAWSDNQDLPETAELVDDLNLGFALRNPRLNRYGERNLLRFRGAVDLNHVGSDEKRMLRVGTELGLHITDENRIVLRAGYKEQMPKLTDVLFGAVTPAKGTFSFGAGMDLLFLSLQGYGEVPGSVLTGSDEEVSPRFGFSAGIVF